MTVNRNEVSNLFKSNNQLNKLQFLSKLGIIIYSELNEVRQSSVSSQQMRLKVLRQKIIPSHI